MLALSPYLLFYTVITSFLRRPSYTFNHKFIPSPPFHHLPESIGALYNCISIKMWFYNQFFYLIPRPSPSYITSTGGAKRSLPYWSLFILLYIFFNFLLTSKIYHDDVSLSFLGYLPTIMIFGCIPFHLPSYIPTQVHYLHNNNNALPTLPLHLHSNSDKLAYLSA